MARESIADEAGTICFELDRFELTGLDRLELHGRWFGVRGRRFIRPTLTALADGDRRRLLAELDDKPWSAQDGESWRAVFPWESADPEKLGRVELAVAPDIAVPLPPPGEVRGQRVEADTGRPAPARAPEVGARPKVDRARDEARQARADAEQARTDAKQARREVDEARRYADEARREREAARVETSAAIARRDAALSKLDGAFAERDEARIELADTREQLRRTSQLLAGKQAELQRHAAQPPPAPPAPELRPAPAPATRAPRSHWPSRSRQHIEIDWVRRGAALLVLLVALLAFAIVAHIV